MKEHKLFGNWTIGWYPWDKEWKVRKIKVYDYDVDFEICFGKLQILHWKKV